MDIKVEPISKILVDKHYPIWYYIYMVGASTIGVEDVRPL